MSLKNKELRCVRAGIKPCARQLYSSRVHAIAAANLYGLHITFADFCVVMDDAQWSTKGYRSAYGNVVAYISYDSELCEQAREAEHDNNHLQLGILLGYPTCCAHYFNNVFSAQNTDPVHKNVHPLLQYDDRENQNIFHYPCQPFCSDSMKIARLTLNF